LRAVDCQVAVWFRNACGALAVGKGNAWMSRWGISRQAALDEAMRSCGDQTDNCTIKRWVCRGRAGPEEHFGEIGGPFIPVPNARQVDECSVSDPSPPLNVRTTPNGSIVSSMHNGTRVVVLDYNASSHGHSLADTKTAPLLVGYLLNTLIAAAGSQFKRISGLSVSGPPRSRSCFPTIDKAGRIDSGYFITLWHLRGP
jgi:hypothetical protein